MIQGLAPHTAPIFDAVSQMKGIAPFTLVGGTALSLQLHHRMSEDLDFMKWKEHRTDKCEVEWYAIKQELEQIAPIDSMNLMGFDHVEFVVAGVKLSFYAAPRFRPRQMNPISIVNGIVAADVQSIGAMKLEVMSRRRQFRDYYDIYAILQTGVDIHELVSAAAEHSAHLLKTKTLLSFLTNGSAFDRDADISHLSPIYNVTPLDIEAYIRNLLAR